MERNPNIEISRQKEREKYRTMVYLVFFRHSIPEPPSEESKKQAEELALRYYPPEDRERMVEDVGRLLTEEGRKLALERGPEYFPEELVDIEDIRRLTQAVGFGSPRIRTQETVALIMGAGIVTGEENLEELKKKLNEGLRVGSKISIDPKLDFFVDENTELGQLHAKAYKEGRLLDFLVHESDELAKKTGDKKTTTYSRSAAQIARIIQKYITVEKNWDSIYQKKKEKYSGPIIARFLCSHQTVLECFLAKVIEKKRGIKERDEFIAALDKRGFDVLEGFTVQIFTPKENGNPENPEIIIKYKKTKNGKVLYEFEEKINKDLIEEIIREGEF